MPTSSSSAPTSLSTTLNDASGNQVTGSNAGGPTPITVSLRLNLQVSEVVELFGYPADVALNRVVIDNKVSASSLSGLFTFKEDPSNANAIVGGRGSGVSTAGDAIHTAIAAGSNADNVDVHEVAPFSSGDHYNGDKYTTVGDMVLSWIALNMFGGAGATVAIDNDTDIVEHVNNDTLSGASLAAALGNISQTDLDAIAASVIGQDDSRAGSLENRATDRPLPFYTDDKIFVRINLSGFSAHNAGEAYGSVAASLAGTQQTISAGTYGIENAQNEYDLVLTVL